MSTPTVAAAISAPAVQASTPLIPAVRAEVARRDTAELVTA